MSLSRIARAVGPLDAPHPLSSGMARGLHRREYEHDGCGVVCVARLDGEPSHEVLTLAHCREVEAQLATWACPAVLNAPAPKKTTPLWARSVPVELVELATDVPERRFEKARLSLR
jgi:hypothetical protein